MPEAGLSVAVVLEVCYFAVVEVSVLIITRWETISACAQL